MPFQRPPRLPSVLASALAAAGLMLTVAGCSQLAPLGPDAAATAPKPHHLRAPFVLHAMRVQVPAPAGGCPSGYVTLPGANPGQCYRKTGSPVMITAAAIYPVSLQKPPPGQKAPAQYGFMITLPAAEVTALTAVITTAYHARGALAILAAGRTWALPMVEAPFLGPQLEISFPSRSEVLQLHRMLAPSG